MAGGGAATTHLTCIPSPLLSKFVHHVIDGLCGGAAASHALFPDCPLDAFWLAGREVAGLARDVTAGRLTRDQACAQLSPLGQEGAASVCEAVNARREEIREAMVREALTSTRRLTDFDWNVKVAMSSSTVLDLKQPLVTLRLHTASPHDHQRDTVVEMTAAEVDSLLATLREAQLLTQRTRLHEGSKQFIFRRRCQFPLMCVRRRKSREKEEEKIYKETYLPTAGLRWYEVCRDECIGRRERHEGRFMDAVKDMLVME
ncbi:COMM domain-containing protein 8-like isoform X2 [Scylla paramamosain]|uniref:COMM domain-containing protein 8-like isoform X2 n=1 Tax=Scylla paramamosain TaxID=85552 RepID=UPI00308328E5